MTGGAEIRMRKRKMIFTIWAFLFALILATPVNAFAQKGPDDGEEGFAYIAYISDSSAGDFSYIYSPFLQKYGAVMAPIKGLSYNRKTNTLTVKNFKGIALDCNAMGDDFKIKLVGENSLEFMTIWGYGYGGSVTFTGKGTLTIKNTGKHSNQKAAILLNAEESKTKLTVKKGAKLKLTGAGKVKNGGVAISIVGTTVKKNAISFAKGCKVSKGKITSSKMKENVGLRSWRFKAKSLTVK